MNQSLERVQTNLPTLASLRKALAKIQTADDALRVRDGAAQARDAFKLVGGSVPQCNQYGEIYMLAQWRFGDFVKDIPQGRPEKMIIDNHFPGTHSQRQYAKQFRQAVQESEITEYVQEATAELKQASIADCLEWKDPGRHGNLKGEYEWYTPADIVNAARDVMGGIDLDPASCAEANVVVQAATYFSEEDDGLRRAWFGRVFLNPPFAHPTVRHFAEKLLESFESGAIDQTVWLSNACTDTEWWQCLSAKGVVCFHLGRIRFYGPFDKGQSPTLGQTIIYLGDRQDLFLQTFSRFGLVLHGV